VGATPRGTRRFYPAIGGSFEGPRLRGEVLPDGGDWPLLRPDGVLEQDVRITLKTDDSAFIYVRYAGMRHGPPEVIARLAQGETVDPSEYYFRIAPIFESGAERYLWLNKILAVGVSERLPPNIVRYTIFEICKRRCIPWLGEATETVNSRSVAPRPVNPLLSHQQ
jgi:hypothetical protein